MLTDKGISVLVTGSNGQLGSEIKGIANAMSGIDRSIQFYFTGKNELDITSKNSLTDYCLKNKITHLINCAAYTAVDKAETEKQLANSINAESVRDMVDIANDLNIRVYHISTDFVFDGTSSVPYLEGDPTNPICEYGRSKLKGETYFEKIHSGVLIRTSWLYSIYGNNFVKTMIRLGNEKDELGVVSDQIGAPTYAKNLAETIIQMVLTDVEKKTSGFHVYHYCNTGSVSWYDFASVIMELSNSKCNVKPIKTVEYPTPAARPKYSVMNNIRIQKDYDILIPEWKESLIKCMGKLML